MNKTLYGFRTADDHGRVPFPYVPPSVPSVRPIIVAHRRCNAFHAFQRKTKQLGNFCDTKSA